MNQALIEENKQKLLAERSRLRAILGFEAETEGLGEFPGEFKPRFPEFGNKDDENANEVTAYQTNLAVVRDLESKLTRVESALERINSNTYGKCKHGDDIEEARLMAAPEADTCVQHSINET